MNKKNTSILVKKFPHFWHEPNDISKSLMFFGFETGDGWFPLIYKLCQDIQKELDKTKPDPDNLFQVVQVKEKFGGLRFYHYGGNDAIEKLIDSAESSSYYICEGCSKHFDKNPPTKQWVYCLCPTCYTNFQNSKSKVPINTQLNK